MSQYLKINLPDVESVYYFQAENGEIELRNLTDSLSILKIYFPELKTSPSKFSNVIGEIVEVMLSNYPIKIKNLDELDGCTIEIEPGWQENVMYTMLSIYDGEPIDNSKISFKRKSDNSFEVTWTGCFGQDREKSQNNLELRLIASYSSGVITPLCLWDEEIIEIFST